MGGQLLKSMADHRPVLISEFYIKRFFRIIPAYLLVLTLYFALPALRESEGIQPLWKFATFTENLGFDGQLGGAFSHAWSLCVEEHFYLVFPILVAGLSVWKIGRRALWIAAAVLLAGIAIRVVLWRVLVNSHDAYWPWYRYIYFPTYSRLDGLLVGVCAAAIECFAPGTWDRLTSRPHLLFCTGLVLLVESFWICEDRLGFIASALSFPFIALAYGLIVIAAVSPRSALHRVHLHITAFVAAVSYSLYLIHKIIIHITQVYLSSIHINIDSTPAFLACLTTSFAAAWTLHVCVERPFMRLRSVILFRRRTNLGRIKTVQPVA
jgi:peptidoglycan/LPS O-acetylase OafA/YrhL